MFTDAVKTRSLAEAGIGGYACLQVNAEGDDAVRLKRLGICQGRCLELICLGNPMILRVSGARIGLSRQLAEKIQIDAIPPSVPCTTTSPIGDDKIEHLLARK